VLLVLTAAVAWLAPVEARPASRAPRRAAAVGVLAIVLGGAALAVAQAELGGGADAPESGPGRLASVQSNRYEYWRVALGTFADHPLIGDGSGGFRVAWLRERPFRESVRDAHSLYLETAAELGLPGLGFLLLFIGGTFASGATALRRAAAPAGTAAALLAWTVSASIDWMWELPAVALFAVVLSAALVSDAQANRAPEASG
jgi:O-antigen ligase